MAEMWRNLPGYLLGLVGSGALEGSGVPWPGALHVLATGLLAQHWTQLVLLASLFSLGYTLGALAQYAIGWALGPAALQWLPQRHRRRLERWFKRLQPSLILWSRPLAIGNYVSIPAGVVRMPLGPFIACTFLGIWPWAMAMLLSGQVVRTHLAEELAWLGEHILPAILVTGTVGLALAAWVHVRRVQETH